MDELQAAAGKLAEQLHGHSWCRGVSLATDPRDGKPSLTVAYRGPLTDDDFGPGPHGFVDEFPVFIRSANRRQLATDLQVSEAGNRGA